MNEYLTNLKAPKTIWLSEDGTGIVAKVTFDAKTKQLIGLVLPIDARTGVPTPFKFVPQTVEEIENIMQGNPKSSLLYAVLAQPITNAPPFILQVFGTDNRFRSKDVLMRWRHTRDNLAR